MREARVAFCMASCVEVAVQTIVTCEIRGVHARDKYTKYTKYNNYRRLHAFEQSAEVSDCGRRQTVVTFT